jgi:hypothetical protein
MNVETVRTALLWCTVINYAMLLLWALLALLTPGYIRWHGRLFRLSAEQTDAISYGGMVLYKMGILLFNLVPCIALWIVA